MIPVFEKNKDKYPINAKKIEEIKEAIVAYKSGTLKSVEDAPAIKTIFYERKINLTKEGRMRMVNFRNHSPD